MMPPTPTTPTGYDPGSHDNQLVAVFEDQGLARGARDALLGAGIPADAIEMAAHAGDGEEVEAAAPAEDRVGGFWAALGRLFAPHDDAHDLGEALGRGHVMVVVHPAHLAERETAVEVLEGLGPLDLDERRAEWHRAATDLLGAGTPERAADAPADERFVRIVEERLRVGWRDRPAGSGKVRSYLAPRAETTPHRVELHEEDIGDPDAPH